MICLELINRKPDAESDEKYKGDTRDIIQSLASQAEFSKYQHLHNDGRRLVTAWFGRAQEARQVGSDDLFETFIYAWIAFNSWGSCVTKAETDNGMIKALSANRVLCQAFDNFAQQDSSLGDSHVLAFHKVWPILSVQELRGLTGPLDIRMNSLETRQQRVEYILHTRAIGKHAPACSRRRLNEPGGAIPLDWPHTLAATYKVRCNLFHGDKAIASVVDHTIVAHSCHVLMDFLMHIGFPDRIK